jgi:hypothetical protein
MDFQIPFPHVIVTRIKPVVGGPPLSQGGPSPKVHRPAMSTVYGMLLGATMPQSGLLLRRYRESVESCLVSAVLFASGVQQLKGRNELKYRAIPGDVRQRRQIKRLSISINHRWRFDDTAECR